MNNSQKPASRKLNSGTPQKPGTTVEQKDIAHHKEPDMDLLEKDFKMTLNDDTMTDDENQDTFIGLAHESTTSIHPYHTNSKQIVRENNQMIEHQQQEITLQGKLYERKSSFSRRPSQLLHERTSLNALCPPSHILKARKHSKAVVKPSTSNPISVKDKNRKSSIVDNYAKEFSHNSAVSPRFMALRKLSEITNLPSHSISYSIVPPVPQIPSSTYQPNDEKPKAVTSDDQFWSRIDNVIESQLQLHLGQIASRVSESHLDARRFWEEQKKEMFGFAATLIDRMEMQRRMAFESNLLEKDEITLGLQHNELSMYKSKYTEAKRQLFELEVLKTRNLELEKQHEIDLLTIKQLSEEQQQQQKTHAVKDTSMYDEQEKQKQPIDSSKVFGKRDQGKQTRDWADMMESQDEAKKSADEWAQKYRKLQASYLEVCLKLEKNQVQLDAQKKIYDRHLKQAQDVNTIQLNYLQMELNKKHHEKQKKKMSSESGGYTIEDGYLTFTTEINGQPSKYTVKIPNANANHYKPTSNNSCKNHLNPGACEWKKNKTKN